MINLTNKIEASKARLEEAFSKHKKAVLWFSGGKDSLVVHHIFRVVLRVEDKVRFSG